MVVLTAVMAFRNLSMILSMKRHMTIGEQYHREKVQDNQYGSHRVHKRIGDKIQTVWSSIKEDHKATTLCGLNFSQKKVIGNRSSAETVPPCPQLFVNYHLHLLWSFFTQNLKDHPGFKSI